MNKYPSKKTPYRYIRRNTNTCCVTANLKTVKMRYPSREEAQENLEKWGGELYECVKVKGTYHIRRKRS